MVISFEELRQIKDSLPDGSIHQLADELGLSVETVRNYFGGYNYQDGQPMDVHLEKGNHGGYVQLEDTTILDAAKRLLETSTVA